MAYPVFAANCSWYKGTTKRATITEINIVDSYTPTGSETESWNADSGDTGAIKCYITGTVLTIAGDGSGMIAMNEDASWMFSDSTKKDYFKNVVNINGTELLDTSNATTFMRLFQSCEKLTYVNVADWDTHNVTSMHTTFSQCYALDGIDVSNWDTSNVTTLRAMFQVSVSLKKLDLSKWNVSKVTEFLGMFMSVESFGSMALVSVGDISNWDTSSAVDMDGMFQWCGAITLPPLRWDTSNVTNFQNMFQQATSLKTLDLSTFDTRNASKIALMFDGVTALEKITIGENFRFAGDGTGTAAVLPTTADGNWYDADGNAYVPAEIPEGVAGTYYASLDAIVYAVRRSTMSRLADAVRGATGSVDKMNAEEMTAALDAAKLTAETLTLHYEDGTQRTIEVLTK